MLIDRSSSLELRDYQRTACRELWQSLVANQSPATLLVAPCGAGKTICLAAFIRAALEKLDWHTLFLAPKREIVHQTVEKCTHAGLTVGTIMSGEVRSPDRPVQVASTASYLRWRGIKVSAEYPKLVIVDEGHLALSRATSKLLQDMKAQGTHVLGATATPIRADGQGLGRMFHDMVLTPDVGDLTALGFLVPMDYYVGIVPDVSGVKLVARDYSQDELQQVLDKDALVGDVVTNYGRLARNRKALLFATGVQHSTHLRDRLRASGVRAEHIDGTTPRKERDRIHALLNADMLDVVCNANVYIEGTDLPVVSCIIDAQPTKSIGRYLQKAGRGLRPFPGKETCVYLDHAGNVYEHGRVEAHRHWMLTQGRELGEALAKQKRVRKELACDGCGFLFAGPVCPQCGQPREAQWTAFKGTVQAELQALERAKQGALKPARSLTPEEQREWYAHALAVTRKWGKRDGFAAYAFRDKFGKMPPFSVGVAFQGEPRADVKSYLRSRLIRSAKRVRSWSTRGSRP